MAVAVAPAQELTCTRSYLAVPGQVAEARHAVTRLLADCPEPVRHNAELIVSELATNSILHSLSRAPGATLTVVATYKPGSYIFLEVQDDGGPWGANPASDEERGRGLDIVGAIADEWGMEEISPRADDDNGPVTESDSGRGRIVWARLLLTRP